MTYKHVTYETAACRAARQDCIDRRGDCAGCPHAVPSLGGSCMIRHAAQVVEALGEPASEKPKTATVITLPCQDCEASFSAEREYAKYCPACKRARKTLAAKERWIANKERKLEQARARRAAKAAAKRVEIDAFGGIDSQALIARLGITPGQLRSWQQLVKPIPYRVIAGRAYFNPEEVAGWLEAREQRRGKAG